MFPISDKDFMSKALITEQGYLMLVKSFTDDLAWEVQRKLVSSYFNVHQSVNDQLSPELQALQGLLNQMVQKELADKERDRQIAKAQDTAQKAIETTEHIKEAVKPVFDNWRNEINAKFNRIQRNADRQFNVLRAEMYSELEHRAGCDLNRRIRNRRERMAESGCTKTEISALNKMDRAFHLTCSKFFSVQKLEKEKKIVNSEINMCVSENENLGFTQTVKNLFNIKSSSSDLVAGTTDNMK